MKGKELSIGEADYRGKGVRERGMWRETKEDEEDGRKGNQGEQRGKKG